MNFKFEAQKEREKEKNKNAKKKSSQNKRITTVYFTQANVCADKKILYLKKMVLL